MDIQEVKRRRDMETDRTHDTFWEILEGQEADIRQLRTDLAQEQQANAALLAWFKQFRALVCKAAWALGLTNRTGFSGDSELAETSDFYAGLVPHGHGLFTEEQRLTLCALAALDTSRYAPQPPAVGNLVDGTGTGEPPVPPRYDPREPTRAGRIHKDSKLPLTHGARPS